MTGLREALDPSQPRQQVIELRLESGETLVDNGDFLAADFDPR